MFSDIFQISAESWRLISAVSEGRSVARSLLKDLAEVLELSVIGIIFIDEKTAYTWSE